MLWEGIRLYSREQYAQLPPSVRFILTEDVRKYLHPEIPEKYLNKSLILIKNGGSYEIQVEGENFLVVDDKIEGFAIIGRWEAQRRYKDDMRECAATGGSLIANLYQPDQDALLKKYLQRRSKSGEAPKPAKRGLFGLRRQKTETVPEPREQKPAARKKKAGEDPEMWPADPDVAVKKTATRKPAKAVPQKNPAEKTVAAPKETAAKEKKRKGKKEEAAQEEPVREKKRKKDKEAAAADAVPETAPKRRLRKKSAEPAPEETAEPASKSRSGRKRSHSAGLSCSMISLTSAKYLSASSLALF